MLRQNLLLFRPTSIGKILDNYRARQNSKNQLMQTKRRLQGYASKQAQLKKQEDKETRLHEKQLKAMQGKQDNSSFNNQ